MMSEQKDKVSIKEETDAKETNGSIEELTAVVKECVVAIKQLERGLNDFYKMQSLTFKDFNNIHINFTPLKEKCDQDNKVFQVSLNGGEIGRSVIRGTQV